VDDRCCEVPAGGLSPGLTPKEVARREPQEEVGGVAADLRYVGEFHTYNGICNWVAYVYFTTGVACPGCSWSGSWEKPATSRLS
jgi:8-oxo-dGTP pyrophosphatase MutT (NUDIX family)